MMPLASMAIVKKLKVSAFLELIYAYPSKADIFHAAALSQLQETSKPWQKKLIQKLVV